MQDDKAKAHENDAKTNRGFITVAFGVRSAADGIVDKQLTGNN